MRLPVGRKVRQFSQLVEVATDKVGSTFYPFLLVIMLLTTFEVTMRYVFQNPTFWVWSVNKQLFGLVTLFAGGYALLYGRHIKVEILQTRFGSRLKLGSNVLSLVLFVLFLGVVAWQGYLMAAASFASREQLVGLFKMPLYPLRMLIPVAALLFLLQGVASFLLRKDIQPHD